MFSQIDAGDIRILMTYGFLLLPASFYGMGLLRGAGGRCFFIAGIISHVLGIVLRGLETGGIPLAEKHDIISFAALSMAFGYLHSIRRNIKDLDIAVIPLIVCAMVVSFLHMPVNTVSPLMKTPWFYIHTFFFSLSFGLWGVSSCIGILYLYRRDSAAEAVQYSTGVSGWILFTVSMVSGSIWFYIAHGTYWLWTSKELWMTITWFYYGLYLHARLMKGLRGRFASALGVLGFAVALFAYFGVGTIIPSPPTQF